MVTSTVLIALGLVMLLSSLIGVRGHVGHHHQDGQLEDHNRHCGTSLTPEEEQEDIKNVEGWVKEHVGRRAIELCTGCITINTHFHVITKNNGQGNLRNDALKSQMQVLNDVYASTPFQFKLESITRTANNKWYNEAHPRKTVDLELEMHRTLRKGERDTLNVYFNDNPCCLGYSTLAISRNAPNDGIVILRSTVPGGREPYHLGKTLVHEVGHWLGLYHPWRGDSCSGQGDFVNDTPRQKTWSEGCDVGKDSCPNHQGRDNVHNFMEYSIDSCMNHFTDGQIERMYNQWYLYRDRGNSSRPPSQTSPPTPPQTLLPAPPQTLLPTPLEIIPPLSPPVATHTTISKGNVLLYQNQKLFYGKPINLPSLGVSLVQLQNGMVVLYQGKRNIWSSKKTGSNGPYTTRLQNDGHFLTKGSRVHWKTGKTGGSKGKYVLVVNSALSRMIVYRGTPDALGTEVWSTKISGDPLVPVTPPAPPPSLQPLNFRHVVLLEENERIHSNQQKIISGITLRQRSNGNFIVSQGNTKLWETAYASATNAPYYTSVQADGHFITRRRISKNRKKVVWKNRAPGSSSVTYVLAIGSDFEKLGVYEWTAEKIGQELWSTSILQGRSITTPISMPATLTHANSTDPAPTGTSIFLEDNAV